MLKFVLYIILDLLFAFGLGYTFYLLDFGPVWSGLAVVAIFGVGIAAAVNMTMKPNQ